MARFGSERGAVQNPFLRYATEAGWTYLPPEQALTLRGGDGGLLLRPVFLEMVQQLNPGTVDAHRAEDLARRVERVLPRIEGNLEAWEYLRGLRTVFVPEEKRERDVRLLDAAHWEANRFHVTDELRFYNGTHAIRLDVALFVNGVPVLLVETKAAHKRDGIALALDQIRRYHREGPELLALLQVHALTHLVQFYYGPTWNLSRKVLFNWKEETAAADFESLVKAFVHPQRLLRVLTDFILFTRQDDELSKAILRPHQMRAVERVVRRAADPAKRRGLVWHTQGSGKTYTMIVVAQQLIQHPLFANPTVLMLVDRNELEAQLFGNLAAVGFGHVEVAQSKRHLQDLLRRQYRGLIVSTIHKFEDMPAAVDTRDNIIVLVDEAHRTTGGTLGNLLLGALPHATYIGFTGTPIDRSARGQSTFQVFGRDDPQGYLDKYGIAESIADGTTVPLHYSLAPSDLRVDRATLEREFLSLVEAEGVSDIEELNRILEKAVTLRNMLKNRERMERIAAYVADHYRRVVEPMGYKAFLVAVDREACALYKEALDHHLPPEYSEVVYSPFHGDEERLARFHHSEEEEKRIRRAFRKPEALPKILIVTEKLLTGFDAPILYCMYLDKPMRDHVLLQAMARVNRPYEDEQGRHKPAGFVLDFVGIFENLEKALAFDSRDVAGVLQEVDLLRERFARLIEQGRAEYLSLAAGAVADKAVERVLAHFRDEEARQAFYHFFQELQDLYEILSPDEFLRPYVDDYDQLARMYELLRAAYEPAALTDRELLRKTERLVQEQTQSGPIQGTLDVYEINEGLLQRIAAEDKPDTVKVFNLLKSVQARVSRDQAQAPYLLSIGERAEAIIRAYQERQVSTQEALRQLEALIAEINQAEQERAARGFSPAAFTVYWLLRRNGIARAEEVANRMAVVFGQFPYWQTSDAQGRAVRQALYKVLLEILGAAPRGATSLRSLVDQVLTLAGQSRA